MPRYALETIIIILTMTWLMGWVVFPVGSNLIHLVLLLALIVVGMRIAQPRPVVLQQ